MASKLGYMGISRIEGDTLVGTFSSINENNVYTPYKGWAGAFFFFAWLQHGEPSETFIGKVCAQHPGWLNAEALAMLEGMVDSVTFSDPNTNTTDFTITVKDRRIFDGLRPCAWDDYYFG